MAGPGGREVGRLSVRVLPNTSNFATSLQRYLNRIEARSRLNININPDFGDFATVVAARLRAIQARSEIDVPVRLDQNQLDAFTNRIASLGRASGGTGRELGRLQLYMRAFVASLPALPALASVGQALVQMGPAAAVAAPALLSLATVGGAVAIGMRGVTDAISGTDGAMAKLTPSARAFATSIRGLSGPLKDLQKSVQEALFKGLGTQLSSVATTVLPQLKSGLTGSASAANLMAKGLLSSLQWSAQSGVLKTAITGVNTGLTNMAKVPGNILKSFLTLSAGAAPAFERVTAAVDRGLAALTGKLQKGLDSGGLTKSISGALDIAKQFGGVLKDVGRILGNIFGPIAAAGSGLSGVLGGIIHQFADITGTKEFANTLKLVFQTLSQIGSVVSGAVGTALSGFFSLIASAVKIVAPALQQLASTVGPELNALISSIMTALGPIVTIVAQAIAQILPIIGQLVDILVGALAPVILQLGPIIAQLVGAFVAGLMPVLPSLVTAFQSLVTAIMPIVTAIISLINILMPVLVPVITFIVNLIASTLVMGINGAAQAFTGLQQIVVGVWNIIKGAIMIAWGLIKGIFTGNFSTLAAGWSTFWHGLWSLLKGVFNTIVGGVKAWLAVQMLGAVRAGMAAVKGLFTAGWAAVRGVFTGAFAAIRGVFNGFRGTVGDIARAAMTGIKNAFVNGWNAAKSAASTGISRVVSLVRGLPSKARSALGSLGSVLVSAGKSLIQGFIRGITSMISGVKNTLTSITHKLTSWKGPESLDKRILIPAGHYVIGGFVKGLADKIPDVKRQLTGFTADIPGMVGNVSVIGEASLPDFSAGLQPGDRISLDVDGQNTLSAVIQRGASDQINQSLGAPAALGRR